MTKRRSSNCRGPFTRKSQSATLPAICGSWLLFLLAAAAPAAAATNTSLLQFIQPTNNAVFSTLDEIPIVLRGSATGDVFLGASVLANQQTIATVSYCCSLCPCFHPGPGDVTILQIPVPRIAGVPMPRNWQGWTNVQAGRYLLTARATGEVGTIVQTAPVTITVVDLGLRLFVGHDGSVTLAIPQGSLVPGGYDAQASSDLRSWTRLGSFQPGNVAAFYFDGPPQGVRERRFYRSVYIPPRLQ